MKLVTELKWAKFGQWRSAEMWPVESVVKITKQQKVIKWQESLTIYRNLLSSKFQSYFEESWCNLICQIMNYSGINILWDKERICRHMDFNKQTKFKNADFDVPELRALNINTC